MRLVLAMVVIAAITAGCTCNPANEPVPQSFAAPVDCAPAVMAAPVEQTGPCGPPPANALPGEVWCCVPVEVPGAPPCRVCVQEECVKRVCVPAVYETIQEEALIAAAVPGRTEWRRVDCNPAQAQAGQTECWQLIEIPAVPAQYEARSREVLKSPATYINERIPARYEEVPAAPNMVWQWKRFSECEVPANAAAVYSAPPADCDTPPAGFGSIE